MYRDKNRPIAGILGSPLVDQERTVFGDVPGSPEVLRRLAALTPGAAPPADPAATTPAVTSPAAQAPLAPRALPKAPPMTDTNPWAHGNRAKTLLDIGAAFLSHGKSTWEGLGAAGEAIGKRADTLKAENTPTHTLGGPDNLFDITTDKNGNRVITPIPEFLQVHRADQDAKKEPKDLSPDKVADLRSRVLYNINQLPDSERPAEYARVMLHPEAYGIDTKGMPPAYDPHYVSVAGGMGSTVSQSVAHEDRVASRVQQGQQGSERLAQGRERLAQGQVRLSQGQQRINKSGRKASASKPPAGYILD